MRKHFLYNVRQLVVVVAAGLSLGVLMPAAPVVAAISGTTTHPDVTETNRCRVPYSELNKENCLIISYILLITNIISGLAGIIIAGSIVVAGIQYSASGSSPQVVAEARKRIRNAVLAMFLFAFAYAIIQWLVPGGTI